ncbi:polysaccharide biosynthesis C-terminal domain-containing protein [Nonomuraea rhizosphaerae]|uniref:polysaccharide biosynthesis C-terminal domain-containing protein n=1 Tax=Nonomuraea rhizosphaerae TaxID=2665663 RepID=UPI001C5D7B78|nr:polysaccharide biosynthesis C-terminal domain-containing protein [Nonomuraea rhizosphaerae]
MFSGILRAAVPLFLSMVTTTLGTLVVTSVLGRHATVTLAAFAVMSAVLNPASAAVVGALRGLAPFVAPYKDTPAEAVPILRDARWLTLLVGTAGALAVLLVPALARAAGTPAEVVAELGPLPWLLALYLLVHASGGGANTVLVALGHSRQVLWSSLAAMAVMAGCTVALVPPYGLAGVGVAWLASGVVGVAVSNFCLRRAVGVRGAEHADRVSHAGLALRRAGRGARGGQGRRRGGRARRQPGRDPARAGGHGAARRRLRRDDGAGRARGPRLGAGRPVVAHGRDQRGAGRPPGRGVPPAQREGRDGAGWGMMAAWGMS